MTAKLADSGVGPTARSLPGPALLLAGFGIVPLGVAAWIAFLSPAAALVTAFSVVVIAASAIALLALDMAADESDALAGRDPVGRGPGGLAADSPRMSLMIAVSKKSRDKPGLSQY